MNTAVLKYEHDEARVEPLVRTRLQAARRIGISPSGLDILHRRGEGPKAVYIGRRRLYLDADLLEYLQARGQHEAAECDDAANLGEGGAG